MRISLEIAKIKYKVIIAGFMAISVIAIVFGIALANYWLASMARCDERGLVTINFSGGASFTCIPQNQIPPNKPPTIRK